MKATPAELDKRLRALIEKWPDLWVNRAMVVGGRIKPVKVLDYESLDRIVAFLLSDPKVWAAIKTRIGAKPVGAPRKAKRKDSPENLVKLGKAFRKFEKDWQKAAARKGLPLRNATCRADFIKKHRAELDWGDASLRSCANKITKAVTALKAGRFASITIGRRRYVLPVEAAEAASIFASQGWWWSVKLEQVLTARCITPRDLERIKGVRDRARRERKALQSRGVVFPELIPFEVIR
jgi:hypothetical protein